MDEILTSYLKEQGHLESSIASYSYMVEKFKEWMRSEGLDSEYATYNDLIGYVQHLRSRKLSQRTISHYMIGLDHYYKSLIKAKLTDQNPVRQLEIKTNQTKRLYPILTKEQLEGLYTNFKSSTKKTRPTAEQSAIRNKIATGLMVFQGLDVTALSRITTKDVDVLSGTVRIKAARTHNERKLTLHGSQIIGLDRYQSQTRKALQEAFDKQDSDLLLITGYHHYRDAHKRLISSLKRQERALLSARQIRASVITHWLKSYNLREVQYMVGHRQIHSTESYKQNDTEGLKIDIDRFHPMNESEQ
jgi:integrase/recombinase XerD